MAEEKDPGTKVISFRVSPVVHDAFVEKVPWGIRSYILEALIVIATKLFTSKNGRRILGDLLMDKHDSLEKAVMDELKVAEND